MVSDKYDKNPNESVSKYLDALPAKSEINRILFTTTLDGSWSPDLNFEINSLLDMPSLMRYLSATCFQNVSSCATSSGVPAGGRSGWASAVMIGAADVASATAGAPAAREAAPSTQASLTKSRRVDKTGGSEGRTGGARAARCSGAVRDEIH